MLVHGWKARRKTRVELETKWLHVLQVKILLKCRGVLCFITIYIFSRTIMHEFMHALGLFHMQSRPDRDNYVQIHFDNIQDGKEHNFNKCESCLTFDVPYDAKSFMHYKYYYFAKDYSKPTISSLVSTQNNS